jgi:hypothetical protein
MEALEPAAEIVGGDEVVEVPPELVVVVVSEAFESGILDGSVHPLDLTITRHDSPGALRSC